jgi:flagellar L-ring protein precursor FlgH
MLTRSLKVRTTCASITFLACVLSNAAGAHAQNLFEPEAPAAQRPAQSPTPPGNPVSKPGAPGQTQPASPEAPPTVVQPVNPSPPSVVAGGETAPANPAAGALDGLSMFVVTPVAPKRYAKHDLVEIIVNESSVQKFTQTTDNKKDYTLAAELSKFPSLKSLIEAATLEEGIGSVKPGVGVKSNNKYKGEGKMNRADQVTTRITATVLDVKPNGTLVLEAKESITTDREVSTMVLAGVARAEDITRSNTVQSSQLANLTIRIDHTGDVKDASEKGLIPRVLDTVFNF